MNQPKETNVLSGYYEIPGFSRYAVSESGQVLNKLTGGILSGSTNPAGYHNYRLTGDDGHVLTWGRHRLVGFVFKNPGRDIRGLVINHENGIKGDDATDNLEWMTQKGNVEHAGRIGISEKCIPIEVRDVDTGVVTPYASMKECARAFGVSKDTVQYRLGFDDERVFPERKQYRPATVKTPWRVPEDVERELLLNSQSNSVMVRYVLTGQVMEFIQQEQLARHLGVCSASLSVWIRLPDQPVLPGMIQLKYSLDPTEWREVEEPYTELARSTGKRPVKAYSPDTEQTLLFETPGACAKAMGISKTTLNWRLKSEGTKIYGDGFCYSYYSSDIPQSS